MNSLLNVLTFCFYKKYCDHSKYNKNKSANNGNCNKKIKKN